MEDARKHGQVYLSVRALAVRASVTPRTVKRWIAAGLLPATRLPSPKGLGPLRVKLTDFEIMMTRNTKWCRNDCFDLVLLDTWENVTS